MRVVFYKYLGNSEIVKKYGESGVGKRKGVK
jgi:hypothetical protein